MKKMATTARVLFALFAGLWLTGCATIPTERGLGLVPVRAVTPELSKKPEALFRALVVVDLPSEQDAHVYRFQAPKPWMDREFVAKGFPRLDGGSVLIVRKASRAEITYTDGTRQDVASALMYQDWYYVFGSREIAEVRIYSADGGDSLTFRPAESDKVSRKVVSNLYQRIEMSFPKTTPKPIGGHTVRYGQDAFVVATQVVDRTEHQEALEDCGVLTVSSGEILGIASGQFWSILPSALNRFLQGKCVANAWNGTSRLLQKGPDPESKPQPDRQPAGGLL